MSNFLETTLEDLKTVFFNDFASVHKINDKSIPVIVDADALSQRKLVFKGEGVYKADYLLYIRKSDYVNNLPKPGAQLNFDDRPYFIKQSEEDDGLYIIAIGANRT